MVKGVEELVQISREYGKNPEYVIAGGGNTSFKNEEFLWIKGSGTSLATIEADGFVKMNRKGLEEISKKKYSADPIKRESEIKEELNNCIAGDKNRRPSVETSLHNLMDQAFVIHTHPTLVNALMCSKNSREETEAIFGPEVLFIEYTDPGYILFKVIESRIEQFKAKFNKTPQVIFLENHGVFVGANTTAEVDKIYEDINAKLKSRVQKPLPSTAPASHDLDAYVNALVKSTGKSAKAFYSDLIAEYVSDNKSFEKVQTAFTPDNIVYCKAHYLFSESDPEILVDEYKTFESKMSYPPRVIGVKDKGLICLEEDIKSVNTVYEVYLDMLKIAFLSDNFGGPQCMTATQIEFIDNWEVENYRRQVAKQG